MFMLMFLKKILRFCLSIKISKIIIGIFFVAIVFQLKISHYYLQEILKNFAKK